MERRGFMSFLAAGVAGLMLPDTLIVEPAKLKVPVPADLTAVNLRTITEALAAEFERQMGAYTAMSRTGGYRVGDYGFDKQYNVSLGLPRGEVTDVMARYVLPCASSLVNVCKKDKVKTFGNLSSHDFGESVHVGPIRGSVCVDVLGFGNYGAYMRFDVLAEAA